MMNAPEPTAPAERIEALDVLRGFALFGVLMVNLHYWFRTHPLRYTLDRHPWPGAANAITDALLPPVFDGKFIGLFSFLFGAGLMLQRDRADARGAGFSLFALRRLGFLLVLGVAHVVLIWMGDILHVYAVVGLLLLFALGRKPKTVFIVFAVLLALPLVGGAVTLGVTLATRGAPAPRGPSPEVHARLEEAIRIYGQGSWTEVMRYRLVDYVSYAGFLPRMAVYALTLALAGVAAWKAGILKSPAEHVRTLRRVLGWGAVALAVGLAHVIAGELGWVSAAWLDLVAFSVLPPAQATLALAYGAGILLLLQREAWRARLAPLGAVGQMALTNYLLQSLICSLIFYGFGAGLYDRVPPAAGAVVVVAIYAAQVLLSRIWLRRFRFGPAEWLWRTATYLKVQPMRR